MEYLNELNESQREAVLYIAGPSLVIAGAGSGKTKVLTCKVAYLLSQGWSPHGILALTFTNKAAREMKTRIAALTTAEQASNLWMGTFHSIFSRILRREAKLINYPTDFTIYDSDDSRSLIKSIIKEMGLEESYRPGMVHGRISHAKNALITAQSYPQTPALMAHDDACKTPMVFEIYDRYQKRCTQAGAMDFDDLLLQTNILFRDHPDALDRYASRFNYILVDEYQDTNSAQYLIIKRLAQKHQRLCVVGDDAQSIYSFRGANIDNILQFRHQYPDCRIFKLERNYRSTQNIVNAANSLIAKNDNQIRKTIYSEKEKGARISLFAGYSDHEEAYIIASKIVELRMNRGDRYTYNDFAILYRTNAQSRVLEEALRKRNIPYRIYGGLSFYQRKEVKDVMAYLRLIVNPDDEEALKRVINYPARGIGEGTLGKILNAAHSAEVSAWQVIANPNSYGLSFNAGILKKIGSFHNFIASLIQRTDPIDEVAAAIVRESGIAAEFINDKSIENLSRKANIEELIKGIAEFVLQANEEQDSQPTLADFLAEAALYTEQDSDKADGERITLMTVHAAKGLEFRNVVVSGLEDDLFPSSMSQDNPRAIEEERRLFYVAITRAEENCIITYAKSRFRHGRTTTGRPSRFLFDLDPSFIDTVETEFAGAPKHANAIAAAVDVRQPPISKPAHDGEYGIVSPRDLSPGMAVMHERFGAGTVQEISLEGGSASAIIDFDTAGRKRLILKYAYLKIG
ncbi:MAG: UvrD-helicase domain-containing protein [Tannerellaceae bacterium]|nr:UvrD-helicase domain-containing protein [Tannerellaceae bacterium]